MAEMLVFEFPDWVIRSIVTSFLSLGHLALGNPAAVFWEPHA